MSQPYYQQGPPPPQQNYYQQGPPPPQQGYYQQGPPPPQQGYYQPQQQPIYVQQLHHKMIMIVAIPVVRLCYVAAFLNYVVQINHT